MFVKSAVNRRSRRSRHIFDLFLKEVCQPRQLQMLISRSSCTFRSSTLQSVSVQTILDRFCACTKIYTRQGFRSHDTKKGDCDAFFLYRRKAALRRSLKWSVTQDSSVFILFIPNSFAVGTKNYSVQRELSIIFSLYSAISFSVLYSSSSMGFKGFFFLKQSHQFVCQMFVFILWEELLLREGVKYYIYCF